MNNHAENLRSIAQNDYMIDQHYLREGWELNNAADRIDLLEEALRAIREMTYYKRVIPGMGLGTFAHRIHVISHNALTTTFSEGEARE